MTSTPRSVRSEVGGEATTGDRRVREAVVSAFAWTVGAAGLVWGSIYVVIGLPSAAAFPYGFSLFSVGNILAYRRHGRFRLFACAEMFAILLVPSVLMVFLGGFIDSGGVGLWALLAPIGALMVIGPGVAIGVFAAFVALMGVGVWADSALDPVATLSVGAQQAFLFLNISGVSLVAFWAMRVFLSVNERLAAEQARLREIEKGYVAQEAMMRQQERLATLGKLSAGIAHELNNPAAAAGRATGHLADVVGRLADDAGALLRLGVDSDGLAWVWSAADAEAATDPLSLSDREQGLATWFASRSSEDASDLASALAEIGFDAEFLNRATERYNERQVMAAVTWIADVSRARRLLGEVGTSAGRISEIVRALKGYSHMDGAASVAVDVVSGIEDTLVILRSQLTGITVNRRFDPDLPPACGNPGELNQVWTNLLANAAEALDGSGSVTLTTAVEGGLIRVDVEDDGPGIPADLVGSVFDPFVTTKAPGEGTGLGLNLSHQIVTERHRGSINVESSPGHTRFTVRLPIDRSD